MKLWINAIFYQATWFAAVAGAGRGWWWAGPLVLALFVAWQLRVSRCPRADVVLMLLAAGIGFSVDSLFALGGLLRYATPLPWAHLAPVWIVALWMSFALTLNHSLAVLKPRPWLAAALGGVGAPAAYWIAGHAWGALAFPIAASTWILLALTWAVLTPALCRMADFALQVDGSGALLALPGER